MKIFILVFLVGICRVTTETHSLQYFYTASSQDPNFPEFVVVGMVDDVQIVHYDSNTMTAVPKQDWMKKFSHDDPEYFNRSSGIFMAQQETFKDNIEELKQRFNQTGGVHIYQMMYGCEWDDETDEVYSYRQYGYDGEDFIFLDLKTVTWVAPVHQAIITKYKWDNDRARRAYLMNYHTQICPEWLKKYVNYGRSSLMRKVLPSVSLLQKISSYLVSCHATGFYPDRADLFWRKDGVELHEDVDKGEILPNHDGTFQMIADLKISSVAPEDWKKYDCVFQMSGVKDDVITKLDKSVIRSNYDLSVSLFQMIPSSLVSCHATGFYPDRADLFWKKDGLKLHEDVDKGEILPNHDGTFQMSVDLNISSIALEDWKKYECVFQMSGVKDDVITKLDKSVIISNPNLPSVSLLHKTSSSPVSCHATGFYPDRADLFWRKDGVELHEDVDKGEILPNHDGGFQMSVDLKISSIASEDWEKYECVFQMSGVKDDVIITLDKSVIRTNPRDSLPAILSIVSVVVLAVIAVCAFIVYKKKKVVENQEVQEEMLPRA